MRRGFFCLLLAALCLLCGCAAEVAYPLATERFFVNDFADVLSDADEQAVYQAGVALQKATDAQVVLVTVENTDGLELEEYALGLARDWGIGNAEKDNGVLLLFTTEGPHSRLEIGYGLEGALPDSKAGRILDTYLVPVYDAPDSRSAGLTATYKAVVNEVYLEYGMTENLLPLEDLPAEEEDLTMDDLLLLIPFLVIFALAMLRGRGVWFLPFFFGGHHRGGGGFGGGGGGFRGGGGGFGGGGASR